jgi:TRAP-type transport system periplasmic protein
MAHFRTIAASALIGILAAPLAAQTSWDMPTPYPDATFHTQNIRTFAEEVAEATGGDLEITVHSAGSLFPHGEIKNAVRSMQVPIGEFFLSTLSNEDDAFGLDSQPFLASSYDEARALWEAQKPVIEDLLAEENLMPLFSVAWPPQGLYSNFEVENVDQLNGLRFRAYNATLEKFAQLAGAQPVQVEAVDIPQAFSTGQVDSMITSPTTGVNSKAWDFLSHYSPIDAWVPKNIVVVNQRMFDRLDEATRQAVLDAAAAAEERGWQMSKEESENQTEALARNGITVYEPSEDLSSGLQEIGDQMTSAMRDTGSEAARRVLDAYEGQ